MPSLNPAVQVFIDDLCQGLDMDVLVVQAGNIGEAFAARFLERIPDFFIHLFQGSATLRHQSGIGRL